MKKKFRGEHSSNTSSILRTIASATASVSVGQAVVSDGYYVILANSTNLSTTLTHAGIATSAGTAGTEISIIHHGLVDPTIFNLGDGYACAVGTDVSGGPVRVTDPTCVSGLKYVGVCDVNGAIYVSPRRADTYNVGDFGAASDNVTDDAPAINAAILAAGKYYDYAGIANSAGHVVQLLTTHYCASLISVNVPITLQGASGHGWFGATILRFANDVNPETTDPTAGGLVVVEESGQWAIIKDIVITQKLSPGGDPFSLCHGIHLGGRAKLENVLVTDVQGDGIHIYGQSGGSPTTNVNGWSLNEVMIQNAGRYGLYIHGSDSNAGTSIGVLDLEGNLSHGLYEGSFLGNVFTHVETGGNGISWNGSAWYTQRTGAVASWAWSVNKVVAYGAIGMPTHGNATGYQYKAKVAGTAGSSEPTWPTTIGATVVDGSITWQCWAESGNPVFTPTGSPRKSTFLWIYQEDDQASCAINGDVVLGGNASYTPASTGLLYNAGALLPFVVQPTDGSGNADVKLFLGFSGIETFLAADASVATSNPDVAFAGVNGINLSWDGGYQRYRFKWTNENAWLSASIAGGRGLPEAGAWCFERFYVGNETTELKITALAASSTTGSAPTIPVLSGAWPLNTWVWNDGTESQWPLAWRVSAPGGISQELWGQAAWHASFPYVTGSIVEPTTPNSYAYKCIVEGTAGSTEPSWPVTIGDTVVDGTITWECFGAAESVTFEPVNIESPLLGSIDCSAGGSLTPSINASSFTRLKLTGSPIAPFSIVIPAGCAAGWARVIWNATGQTATVKGSSGDTGVAVLTTVAHHIFSDGTNAMLVT